MLLSEAEERKKKKYGYNRGMKVYSINEVAKILGVSYATLINYYEPLFEQGMNGLVYDNLPMLPLPMITVNETARRFTFSWWDIQLLKVWLDMRRLKYGQRLKPNTDVDRVVWCDEEEQYKVIYKKDNKKEVLDKNNKK